MAERENREEEAVEKAEQVVRQRVHHARKEEVLEIYEDLVQTSWNRLLPTLGRVTVTAIMDRALVMTTEHYPFLKALKVTRNGVSFEALHEQIGEQERNTIRNAMKEFIANLIDLLAMLTGDIIVRQLLKDIEGKQ